MGSTTPLRRITSAPTLPTSPPAAVTVESTRPRGTLRADTSSISARVGPYSTGRPRNARRGQRLQRMSPPGLNSLTSPSSPNFSKGPEQTSRMSRSQSDLSLPLAPSRSSCYARVHLFLPWDPG